jgi:hypothetical protein
MDELLSDNQNITAREVARRHSALSSASTITRHPGRRALLEKYQQRQTELRLWNGRISKDSKQNTGAKLAKQQALIVELENTVSILTAGHVSLIAVVAQTGGMGALAKFYENFREIRNGLYDSGAIPEQLQIKSPMQVSALNLKKRK